MLKKYIVRNFKSFKNTTVFDFEKTNYQMLMGSNVKDHILKGAMFVGANASGKSNGLIAIKFLLDCLFGRLDVNIDAYMCLFSGNPVMELEYYFKIEQSEIVYKIQYQRIDRKWNEELFVDGNCLLVRDGSVAKLSLYKEESYTDVPADVLFLRDIYFNTKFRGWDILQKWFVYMSNSVYLDLYTGRVVPYKDIDLTLGTYLEEKGIDKINNFFREYNFEQTIEYDKEATGNLVSVESAEKMIFFKRKGIGEPLPFVLESLGNQTLLRLLPVFFHCIEQGGLLLLDEFSSGFHNDLEELLIRYFMKKSEFAQLIYVSHSTNLLSNSILRPDQIYSVDFGKEGSIIKRFSSEKPREAQNLEKMYLAGVFNGVPRYEHTIQ